MRHFIDSSVFVACLLALAPAVVGCHSFWGCDASATCSILGVEDEDDGYTCPADPAEGEVREGCGVWVSTALGDDESPGTQEKPVKTLARAIELADPTQKGAGRVYACGGADAEYREWVTLPAGTSLFGGFACTEGWRYTGAEKRAVLHASPAVPTLTLSASDHEVWITDVVVIADDAVEPSGSSIAVMALNGSMALFRRANFIAGDGADGFDGEDGSHGMLPAKPGLAGNDGTDACTVDPSPGGAAVVTQCEDGTQSVSGQGGDGNAAAASDGLPGLPAPDPNPQGHGAGGKGEDAARGTTCTGGAHGAHGQSGAHGKGAKASGILTKDGYFGTDGEDGLDGAPGQGGGGGGASLGANCGALPKGGAGGGSGGAGGCGGRGGKGGKAGGSSVGIALLSNGIWLSDVVIQTGNGGNGGNGGNLQAGGKGGLPGYGGTGGPGGVANGCAGGVGGHGGSGGYGGGGQGGHAASILQRPEYSLRGYDLLEHIFGSEGVGGRAPEMDSLAGAGADGLKQGFVTVDP